MFEDTQLNDDGLRAALFEALVERLEAKAREEPSIAMVNRMPTILAVSRWGNLLTLSQGIGAVLMCGSLERTDRHEKLRTFDVGRASIQSRLTITPDRVEGTPDEILDWILAKFLEWTAEEEESAPRTAPAIREAMPQQRAPAAGLTPDRRPAAPRPKPESRPAAPPRPAPVLDTTMSGLRTYQLLLETAQRELHQAQALPAGSRHLLISSAVLVALAAEAFFNDLGSRAMPSWSRLQRLDPLDKAEVLHIELFKGKADWRVRPFQSVVAALDFRHALAHAHAETLSFSDVATIEQWITDVRLLIELFSRAHDSS